MNLTAVFTCLFRLYSNLTPSPLPFNFAIIILFSIEEMNVLIYFIIISIRNLRDVEDERQPERSLCR